MSVRVCRQIDVVGWVWRQPARLNGAQWANERPTQTTGLSPQSSYIIPATHPVRAAGAPIHRPWRDADSRHVDGHAAEPEAMTNAE